MHSILDPHPRFVTSIISRIPLLILLLCSLGISQFENGTVHADDWPQILGTSRNGMATGETLLGAWPQAGPKKLWSVDCGQGYAGVAVKDNRVFLFHRLKKNDIVECLEAGTGKEIWKKEFVASYRGGFSSDVGPRCVPLVHGDSVYCLGAAGTLRRLSLKDGAVAWTQKLFDEFNANEGYFGAGSSPIIIDETLVVIVGGRKGGIVGFDLDGKLKWKTDPDTASYAAPIEIKFRGKVCAACVSKFTLKIVEVANGKVLWSQDFGKRGPTVNAAMPLKFDNRLFVSAAYNIGARMIDLDSEKTIWENDESMSSQYTTCIAFKNHLIGCNGREDFGNGSLRCIRASDGKVMWDERETGICHLIQVEDKALVWSIDGTLRLIGLNLEKYERLEKSQIFQQNSKSLPALSNGRLFVKSNGDENAGQLTCLQVGRLK